MESLIGEGGMGAVIKAQHLDLDDHVAIKVLLPEMLDRDEIVKRFVREAKAARKLKGEHVARVLDVGRLENNVPYIVMEYLEGADLNAIIKHHGAQNPAIAVDLILQACEAIAEAHSLGIIHRDIKASNFFITQPPNQAPCLKVLDFGIATAPEGTSDLTSSQSVIGTPAYMAPEQMRSSAVADARSDIWSIGVVLYELLEGARPFRSEVYSELVLKVGMDPPHPITNPAVSDALKAITFKCLEKNVDRRYQTVAELAFDLFPYASDAVAARASVELIARLLGRRGSRAYETPNPDSSPIVRITPPGELSVPYAAAVAAQSSAPISSSQPSLPPGAPGMAGTVLGRPTPAPSAQPKTPTSIALSTGQSEVLERSSGSRRGFVIAFTALTLVALGGAGIFLYTQKKPADVSTSAQPPAPPREPPAPDKVEAKADPDEKPYTTGADLASGKPDSTKPDEAQPDKPDAAKPDEGKVDATKPDATKPDATKPDPHATANQTRPVQRPVIRRPVIVKPKDPPKPPDNPGGDLFNRRE